MRLDGALIFSGEINKAPGSLHQAEAAAEAILFTVDPAVTTRICSPATYSHLLTPMHPGKRCFTPSREARATVQRRR